MAQFRLGLLYQYGIGVPQSDVRAYMWLNVAATLKESFFDGENKKEREELASQMNEDHLKEAKALSQQFIERFENQASSTDSPSWQPVAP